MPVADSPLVAIAYAIQVSAVAQIVTAAAVVMIALCLVRLIRRRS